MSGYEAHHFSLGNPEGPSSSDLPLLLRRLADLIEEEGITGDELLDVCHRSMHQTRSSFSRSFTVSAIPRCFALKSKRVPYGSSRWFPSLRAPRSGLYPLRGSRLRCRGAGLFARGPHRRRVADAAHELGPQQSSDLPTQRAGLRLWLNLIPLNPTLGSKWTASRKEDEREFVRRLEVEGVPTTVRDTRGREIDGACGQLAAAEV